jgi:hypothetical protein
MQAAVLKQTYNELEETIEHRKDVSTTGKLDGLTHRVIEC